MKFHINSMLMAGAIVTAIFVGGCGAQVDPKPSAERKPESAEASPSGGFAAESPFERLKTTRENYPIEIYENFRDFVRAADVAMVGEVVGAHWGREYRDESGGEVELDATLIYEVRPVRVLGGSQPATRHGEVVDVAIDLYDPRTTAIDPPVGEQALWFLRRVGGPIPGQPQAPTDPTLISQNYYRLMTEQGLLAPVRDGMVFPLGAADWGASIAKESWDQAIQTVSELAIPPK